jgi:hypothetical protein
LGTACENSAPVFSWPSESETAAEVLVPPDVTAGAGGPYSGDGTRIVEEPSLSDSIRNAWSVSPELPASALLPSDVPEFKKCISWPSPVD